MFSATSICLRCCFWEFPWLQSICGKDRNVNDLYLENELTNHYFRGYVGFYQFFCSVFDVFLCIIRPFRTSPEYDMNVWVPLGAHSRLDDTAQSLFTNAQKDMARSGSTAGIDCDADGTVS
jgi:hypothetical protein